MMTHASRLLVLGLLLLTTPAVRAQEPVRIVTLGDSITRGVRAGVKAEETFAALLQAELRKRDVKAEVVNVGIGGERTDQALRRLAKGVLALKPRVVTIMYGTNDSYVDRGQKEPRLSAADYGRNLRRLVEELLEAGVRPILMTPPRWGAKAVNGAGENPNRLLEHYVAVCREEAKKLKVPLVDHFAHWSKQAAAGTDVAAWTTDQCHPNPRGHREIVELLLPIVREALNPQKKES
jgi:acyl-CoA thioesterase-1